jgi:DNA repair protein RecN (Recombination protein N)
MRRSPPRSADDSGRGRPYDDPVLRTLRISNLVLIREAELDFDAGLNAITGETGAGKTILTNAIGLLLGARGDAALIGAAGDEAYVEAEFDDADDEALGPLAELRPDGEDGVVLARRIFADGRTRAYAWGRSAAREDVAAAAEALVAMSGQFEQRRLARPSYQRAVLDSFAGLDVREARRRLARAAGGAARVRRADP